MKKNYPLHFRLLMFFLFILPAHTFFAQSWQWAKSGGSFSQISGDEKVVSMVTDATGNSYILASVGVSGLKINNIDKTGIGGRDYMIASFDCGGQYRWSKLIGSGNDDDMQRLQIDAQGNIYAVGKLSRSSQVYFRGETGEDIAVPYSHTSVNTHNQSLFIVKYSPEGVLQWLKMPQPDDVANSESQSKNYSFDLQVDPQGNSYWLCKIPAGAYANGAFVNTKTGNSFYIFKYNAAGQFLGAQSIDIEMQDNVAYYLSLVRNHNTGNCYIAGTNVFDYSMIVGGQLITNAMFVAAFNANGTLLWKHLSNSGILSYLNDLVIDKDNSIYLTGGARNNDTFAGATYTSLKPHEFPFLTKLSADGQLLWSTNAETGGAARSEAIAIRGNEVAVTCAYTTVKWGSYTLEQVPNEMDDVMLARFNKATGQIIGLNDIQGNFGHRDFSTALTADIYGNYLVGGGLGNFMYIPGYTLLNGAAGSDFFVAKYGTDNCNCILLEPDFVKIAGSSGADFTFKYTGTNYEGISWNFGDGGTASGENPQHTFTQPGNHNVCVTITSTCGSKQYCSQVNAVLGTDDKEMIVQMYPNPVKDNLTVNAPHELSYQIFTVLGSGVGSGTLAAGPGQISFNGLSSGWYLLMMSDASGKKKTVKLFKE